MQADRRMDSQTDRQTLISVNHAQGWTLIGLRTRL
uniref:Uncharacterized protein n=1 Tax=Anguilla anguilla TaxID=7936 RepID=A0A0E9W156_ANGAN